MASIPRGDRLQSCALIPGTGAFLMVRGMPGLLRWLCLSGARGSKFVPWGVSNQAVRWLCSDLIVSIYASRLGERLIEMRPQEVIICVFVKNREQTRDLEGLVIPIAWAGMQIRRPRVAGVFVVTSHDGVASCCPVRLQLTRCVVRAPY
jgi:hypothetical protein